MNCVYPPHTGRVVNVTAHESEKKLVVLGALVPSIMHRFAFLSLLQGGLPMAVVWVRLWVPANLAVEPSDRLSWSSHPSFHREGEYTCGIC
jgi:hypothetical protein